MGTKGIGLWALRRRDCGHQGNRAVGIKEKGLWALEKQRCGHQGNRAVGTRGTGSREIGLPAQEEQSSNGAGL